LDLDFLSDSLLLETDESEEFERDLEELSLDNASLVLGLNDFNYTFYLESILLIPFHSISSARLIELAFSPAQHPLPAHPKVKILPNQSRTGFVSYFLISSYFLCSFFSSSILASSSHLDFLSCFFFPMSTDDSISSIGFSNFTLFYTCLTAALFVINLGPVFENSGILP